MARYGGEYECPQCGCGSNNLKPEALAIVIRRFGPSVKLHCDICGHRFLLNEATGRKSTGSEEA